MKGILKIYHPEETLKYYIDSSYCKPIYNNSQHVLEVEITTSDTLDHVDDDSLQYQFPQLRFGIYDFPIESNKLAGKLLKIEENEEDSYSELEIFDDQEAFLYNNQLAFEEDQNGELQLVWSGEIDDFYLNQENTIPFKLKCNFKEEVVEIID